jgi:hypothetical protein
MEEGVDHNRQNPEVLQHFQSKMGGNGNFHYSLPSGAVGKKGLAARHKKAATSSLGRPLRFETEPIGFAGVFALAQSGSGSPPMCPASRQAVPESFGVYNTNHWVPKIHTASKADQ